SMVLHQYSREHPAVHSFPTRRSSDLERSRKIMYTISRRRLSAVVGAAAGAAVVGTTAVPAVADPGWGSEVPRRRADELLRLMKVSAGEETADGPVWSPVATGFASVATEDLPEGAVGGLGGQ